MALVHIAAIPLVIVVGFTLSIIATRLSAGRKVEPVLPIYETPEEKPEVCFQSKIKAMRPRLGSFCPSCHEGGFFLEDK
ncbi:hypothetical protein BDD12DRAFT_867519 [Trichophaea hybrida]|nr:hypothetical protein BDD12DRAFT_867519 [Trichophaea hybrida]